MKCRQCAVRVVASQVPQPEFEVNPETPMKPIGQVFSTLHGDRKFEDGDVGNRVLQWAAPFPMSHTLNLF